VRFPAGLPAPSLSGFSVSAFRIWLPAILKNQFKPAFQAVSCDVPSRRLPSTCSMNSRADATVARWRDALQNLKYSIIAR
jgi:hypothetical protein